LEAVAGEFGLKEQLKIPIVTSFYGYDAWTVDLRVWRRRYDELFAGGDAFLVEGPAMRRRLEELGCSPDVVHVQRIGVDLTALPYQRRHFGDGLNVVMVGRFVEKKGLGDGLRACAMAISGGARIAVTVVGDPAPDDAAGWKIKSELQSLAKSPELSGRVRFTGFLSVKQTRETLAAHNLFLCPSRRAANGDAEGGSPVVLTEAMAMGLLCIGTSHCDIPEVILEGKTGFVCKERDCTAMADILCNLSSNQDRIVGLTESGRRHVEEHFSLDVQLTKLAGIYQSLVAGASVVPRVAMPSSDVVQAR
jgi:colanic acid/amylovoran biosynthesis glycosyltransferase